MFCTRRIFEHFSVIGSDYLIMQIYQMTSSQVFVTPYSSKTVCHRKQSEYKKMFPSWDKFGETVPNMWHNEGKQADILGIPQRKL